MSETITVLPGAKPSVNVFRILGLAILALAVAGCNTPPRVVLTDLPRHSAIQAFGPLTPARNTTSVRPPVADNNVVVRIPDGWIPAVNERPWRWIVLHHSATSAGSAAIFDRAHRKRGWDELGYHFVITNGHGGPDGKIQIGSRWAKQKWGAHCGKTPNNAYNNYGIGICLVGNYSQKLPSAKQLAGLRKLLRFLMNRYEIVPANVIGHRDAPNTATKCPGDAMHRYLNNVLRPKFAR